jgi:hypothetical protein
MTRRLSTLTWILAALMMASGCMGYRVGPVHKADYQSVAVPMFQNETLMPQLEAQVTNAIIKRFQSDGMLAVQAPDMADVVVTGRIVTYERMALRSLQLDTGVTREYRIKITAEISARNTRNGNMVFESQKVSGTADTFIGEDQQSAESQALPLVADDLARQVVSLLTERW